jgi:hypothetical protein
MTTTETYDAFELDDEAALPPPRPRRRLTPLSGALLAVLLVALGFVGGALVQKHVGEDGGAGAGGFSGMPPGGMPAGMAAGGARAGAAGGASAGSGSGAPGSGTGASVGEVTTVKGDVLYVTDASGNTVKVKAAKGATVTRTADARPREIRPGEQVVIQGATRDGTVTATSIRAGELGVAMAAIGGGAPGAAAAPAGGTAAGGSGGGSGGGAVDQLFEDGSGR